jgi:hypothetical protein
MKIKKLAKYEEKQAELIFTIEIVVFLSVFVVFALRSDPLGMLASVLILMAFGFARWVRGPLTGAILIEISELRIQFKNAALGNTEFKLGDIEELRIVGPKDRQRIRVRTKDGIGRDVYCDPWGRRFQRAVDFLRKSLPRHISLSEEEPPSWAESIRGDY